MKFLFLYSLLLGICVVLSFVFSGMEAGVLALSRLRIRQLMRSGDARAMVLQNYLDKPEDFLWTILIGNTLSNFVGVGMVVMFLWNWLAPWPVGLLAGFLAAVFLFYALCELLPKMLFRMFPNRLTLGMARPFRVIHFLLAPLVGLLTRFSQKFLNWSGGKSFAGHMFGSREEMRLVMQESAQGLTSEERSMINRVLDLQTLQLRDIALPLEKVVSVNGTMPLSEILRLAQEKNLTRLPVWREENGRKRILGIVSLRTILYEPALDAKKTAADFLKPALYMDENTRLEVALKRMQRGGQRLAIVLGTHQQEIGIVTLQDILKVIFGEVRL